MCETFQIYHEKDQAWTSRIITFVKAIVFVPKHTLINDKPDTSRTHV